MAYAYRVRVWFSPMGICLFLFLFCSFFYHNPGIQDIIWMLLLKRGRFLLIMLDKLLFLYFITTYYPPPSGKNQIKCYVLCFWLIITHPYFVAFSFFLSTKRCNKHKKKIRKHKKTPIYYKIHGCIKGGFGKTVT